MIRAFASRTTVSPAKSSLSTTFDPPPSTTGSILSARNASSVATTCSVDVHVISRCATGPTAGWSAPGPAVRALDHSARVWRNRSRPGNGSLTSYAAFIRHVRRPRQLRRSGPSRFADERYWQARLADSGADDAIPWMPCRSVPTGAIAVATTQMLRRDRLPGIVTQFHRGDLLIGRQENWTPVDGRKATAQVSGNIEGAPVTLAGDAVMSSDDDAVAHLSFRGTAVEVRVPWWAARSRASSAPSWWNC